MNIPDLTIESILKLKCPKLILGQIVCAVKNSPFNEALWAEIEESAIGLRNRLKIEDIKHIPTIEATRKAYKACGKDPNRYRPSAEQLNRRILQGKGLYQISSIVDLVNLISLVSAYSIGGFDIEKINGALNYGIGEKNEVYEGIGRGLLNIEGIPVLRDQSGGIGTPTSDEMRTRVTSETHLFLMNINSFDGDTIHLNNTLKWSEELLKKYVGAKIYRSVIIKDSL